MIPSHYWIVVDKVWDSSTNPGCAEFNDAMTSNEIGLFAFELVEDTSTPSCMPPSASISNCVPGFKIIKKDDSQPFSIFIPHSIANKSIFSKKDKLFQELYLHKYLFTVIFQERFCHRMSSRLSSSEMTIFGGRGSELLETALKYSWRLLTERLQLDLASFIIGVSCVIRAAFI